MLLSTFVHLKCCILSPCLALFASLGVCSWAAAAHSLAASCLLLNIRVQSIQLFQRLLLAQAWYCSSNLTHRFGSLHKWQYCSNRSSHCLGFIVVAQGEVSVPVVLDAIIQQVSHTAAGHSLLAAAQAADQAAGAEAALTAAFPSNSSNNSMHDAVSRPGGKPEGKKIIYEGDSVASAAAGIVTGM